MSNYRRVVEGMTKLGNASISYAESFVIAAHWKDEPSNKLFQRGRDDKEIRRHAMQEQMLWKTEVDRLTSQDTHIFDFDNDASFLLTITDNDLRRHIHHLPFPSIFIDCTFTLEDENDRYTYCGILMRELTGYDESSAAAGQFAQVLQDMNLRVAATRENPTYKVHHIFATTFMWDEVNQTLVDVRYNIEVDEDALKALQAQGVDIDIDVGVPSDTPKMSKSFAQREVDLLRNITLNFLDVLDTKEVRVAHIPAKPMDEKRKARGQISFPPRHRVILTAPIRAYLDSLREGGHFTYSHSFWVRGHMRHYRNERYAKSGKLGTVQWIMPYIKGKGILVKKPYEVESRYGEPSPFRVEKDESRDWMEEKTL